MQPPPQPAGATRPARGALVGRYVLDDLLAETPRHRIFLGRGLAGGRRVEIKVMDAGHCLRRLEAGESGNPYVRELRLAVDARCECMVRHLDAGTTADGAHFLVRERAEGRSVRDELEADGRLALPEAAAVVADAAAAAAAVHRLGYVLRDFRPEKLVTHSGPTDGAPRDTRVTDLESAARAGTRGTLRPGGGMVTASRCMAPEVAAGGPATEASDVYALAALLYELLCGRPVIDDVGDDEAALAWLTGEGELPTASLREAAPDLPLEADLLVRKGLARSPADRPGVTPLLRGLGHVLRSWADVHGDDRVPRTLWPRLLRR